MNKTKTKIKAIIFDLGGIFVKESQEKHRDLLCKRMKINKKEFYGIVKKYSPQASIGKISAYRFPHLVAKDLKINPKKFYKVWLECREEIFGINKQTEKLLLKLKNNYILGTLTNITKTNDQVRLKYNVYKHFKIKLISNKVGLAKPDQKIYSLLIKKLNLAPDQIVFVDDREEYLPPARKLGIKTILFKNNTQLIKELKKLGVKVR